MYKYQLIVSRRSGETFDEKPRYVFWFRTEEMQCSEAEAREIGATFKQLGDVEVSLVKRETTAQSEVL